MNVTWNSLSGWFIWLSDSLSHCTETYF